MYHAQAATAIMNKLKVEQDLHYLPADKQVMVTDAFSNMLD